MSVGTHSSLFAVEVKLIRVLFAYLSSNTYNFLVAVSDDVSLEAVGAEMDVIIARGFHVLVLWIYNMNYVYVSL